MLSHFRRKYRSLSFNAIQVVGNSLFSAVFWHLKISLQINKSIASQIITSQMWILKKMHKKRKEKKTEENRWKMKYLHRRNKAKQDGKL